MLNILVTGANGFVGSALCNHLSQTFQVTGVQRKHSDSSNYDLKILPEMDNADWAPLLKEVDIIIHLAARVHVMNDNVSEPINEFRRVNVEATVNLANQAAQFGVKRFIFVSSVKVNGEFTEENKPFRENDIANPSDAYAKSKFEAENALFSLANKSLMEIVVIRPPLIYGPGVKANFANMLKVLHLKLPLPLGAIRNKRSFVYIGNLISLIERCITHPSAANQIFLVSDGQDLSTKELLTKCALMLNLKLLLLPIPLIILNGLAILFNKQALIQRLCGNLQVDIAKAFNLLNWKPEFSVEAGLKATICQCKDE